MSCGCAAVVHPVVHDFFDVGLVVFDGLQQFLFLFLPAVETVKQSKNIFPLPETEPA